MPRTLVNVLVFNGNTLVYVTNTGFKNSIVFYDITERCKIRELVGHSGYIWRLRVTPDRKTVVSASEDGTVKFWDVPTE